MSIYEKMTFVIQDNENGEYIESDKYRTKPTSFYFWNVPTSVSIYEVGKELEKFVGVKVVTLLRQRVTAGRIKRVDLAIRFEHENDGPIAFDEIIWLHGMPYRFQTARSGTTEERDRERSWQKEMSEATQSRIFYSCPWEPLPNFCCD